jgi:hypothetical protein
VSVEDLWDRDPNSEDPDDLLHVTYDPARITVPNIIERIRAEDFEAEVR